MDSSNSGEREENRRALLRLYSLYTIQYAAFGLVLALAFVGEIFLIGSSAFPQFVIYPLIIVTIVPAIMSFYYMIRWWRIQKYTLTLPVDAVQGDSLAALHIAYESYADERSSRLIVEGMSKMDGRRVALAILMVFLLSLPISYFAVSNAGFAILVLVVVVSFAAGALTVVLFPPLTSRVSGRRAAPVQHLESPREQTPPAVARQDESERMIDETINALTGQAELLRSTASDYASSSSPEKGKSQAQVSLGDLPNRIVSEIASLTPHKEAMLPRQKEALTKAVSSLTSTVISLGLPADAARIYSAFRAVVPG